jgi:S1-C subfamily serine protease
MSDPSAARSELRKSRWQRIRTRARSAAPFVSGVAATLVALLLFNLLLPAPAQLTARDVQDTVAQTLASATPQPAYARRAFQVIRPSFVLIQTHVPGADGKQENGLGSGVVIDDRGDILTSLHVVAGASDIQLTFADGTQSSATVMVEQPEQDIAVLRADQPPAQIVPATLGNPKAMQIGDEAFVVGNPLGLYGSMSAGVISGLDRTFQPSTSKHSDRRGCESRQLGRAAAEPRRPGDRHCRRDRQPQRAGCFHRHWLCSADHGCGRGGGAATILMCAVAR